jgi:hypothetical protein
VASVCGSHVDDHAHKFVLKASRVSIFLHDFVAIALFVKLLLIALDRLDDFVKHEFLHVEHVWELNPVV